MKRRRDGFAIAAIVLLAAAVGLVPQAERLRVASVDLLFLLRSLTVERVTSAYQASSVVVVAIDEETYRSPPFQDTPNALWTRDIARVLTALVAADIKVVGFDVVYPTSVDRFIPGFDRDFLVALRGAAQHEKVVLGKVQHQTQPITPFGGQRIAVGGERNIRSLNVLTDVDDVVRRAPLLFDTADGTNEPGLAFELAQRSLGVTAVQTADGIRLGDWTIPGSATEQAHLNFRRGVVIPSYSLHDLAACLDTDRAAAFFREQFAGKTIVLGTILDVEDRKVTSMRWITAPEAPATGPRCASKPRGELFDSRIVRDSIPGALIHATAVRNLMERTVLAPAPSWAQHLVNLLLAGISALLALSFKPVRATVLLAGALLLWAAIATAALSQGLILPVIVPAVAAAISLAATLGWRFVVSDRDKKFLRDSFALYLAPALIDRLVDDSNPPALGGEERDVTLFFSDLAGFSTMSEGLTPQETVRVMNAYLGAMTEEIERAGGMVDKYIGDAIVAMFGAPLAAPDHARQAVKAAFDCRARLAKLNQSLGNLTTPLRQRIGLNSGPALIGNIGSDRRFNYTAMGDTVNLAARLEGANKVFGTDILVSEDTARDTPDVMWRELDSIRVVGRTTPVAVYTPVLAGEEALAETYATALTAFRHRDFAAAVRLLEPFARTDKASGLLRRRAEAFLETPPPADWQPVNELTEK
jgi:class 3 adenylate cyclase/CHASE2 domain-containing sensor protein